MMLFFLSAPAIAGVQTTSGVFIGSPWVSRAPAVPPPAANAAPGPAPEQEPVGNAA